LIFNAVCQTLLIIKIILHVYYISVISVNLACGALPYATINYLVGLMTIRFDIYNNILFSKCEGIKLYLYSLICGRYNNNYYISFTRIEFDR